MDSDTSDADVRTGSWATTGTVGSYTLNQNITFCIEMGESVSSNESYTFTTIPLAQAAGGSAPGGPGLDAAWGTNIPSGGIGTARAARVSWLFDNYYQGTSPTAWTYGTDSTTKNAFAFQLALWELSHDDDFTLGLPTDGLGLSGTVSASSDKNNWTFNAAVTMINAANAANIPSTYTSTEWEIVTLANVGEPGTQDLVTAVAAIPEPTSLALLGLGGLALLRRRR